MNVISLGDAKKSGEKYYFTGNKCKRGHISRRLTSTRQCTECQREYYQERKDELSAAHRKWREENRERKSAMDAEYREKNKDRLREVKREYRRRNRKEIAAHKKIYREENADYIRQWKRDWEARNRGRLNSKKSEYEKEKRRSDPLYSIKRRMRVRVSRFIRVKGYEKSRSTEEMVGCTWEELKTHIERQFTKGMSWENMSDWHIDHIVPLAKARSEEEAESLNHFTNLRPCWAKDNLSKADKVSYLI